MTSLGAKSFVPRRTRRSGGRARASRLGAGGRSNLLPALTALDNVMAPVLPYRTSFDKRERAAARAGALPTASITTAAGALTAGVAIALAASIVPALLTRRVSTAELLAAE